MYFYGASEAARGVPVRNLLGGWRRSVYAKRRQMETDKLITRWGKMSSLYVPGDFVFFPQQPGSVFCFEYCLFRISIHDVVSRFDLFYEFLTNAITQLVVLALGARYVRKCVMTGITG